MSLWLADKASGRPLTQTSYTELDSNLFLLESRVGHETAPHLAGSQLMDLSTHFAFAERDTDSLACVCPRKQHTASSALGFFASGQWGLKIIPHATDGFSLRSQCLARNG